MYFLFACVEMQTPLLDHELVRLCSQNDNNVLALVRREQVRSSLRREGGVDRLTTMS